MYLVERVWSQLKVEWGKTLARIEINYDHDNMTRDVGVVCNTVARRLTPKIIYAAEDYNAKALAGQLV